MSQYDAAWDAYAANAAQHQHAAAMAAHHQNYGYGHGGGATAAAASAAGGVERLRLGRPGRAAERPAGRLDVPGGLVFASRSECFKCGERPQSRSGRARAAGADADDAGRQGVERAAGRLDARRATTTISRRATRASAARRPEGQPVHPDGGASASGPAADGRAFNAAGRLAVPVASPLPRVAHRVLPLLDTEARLGLHRN